MVQPGINDLTAIGNLQRIGYGCRFGFMVFNTTFKNNSVISWRSDLLVVETTPTVQRQSCCTTGHIIRFPPNPSYSQRRRKKYLFYFLWFYSTRAQIHDLLHPKTSTLTNIPLLQLKATMSTKVGFSTRICHSPNMLPNRIYCQLSRGKRWDPIN